MHSRLAESETLSRDRWTADARAGLDRRCRYSGVLGEGWGVLAGDCWTLWVACQVTLVRQSIVPTLERGNDQKGDLAGCVQGVSGLWDSGARRKSSTGRSPWARRKAKIFSMSTFM